MKKKIALLIFCSLLPIAAGCRAIAGNSTSKSETVNTNVEQKPANTINNPPANSMNINSAESKVPPKIAARNSSKGMTLQAIGNGEKVKIAYGGKSKIVKLEADFAGDFTAGGDAPYRYTTLLSVKQDDSLYLVAKFRSGPAISDPNSPCGGDLPSTLLLIVADLKLSVEKVQTEIFDSCIYNGAGRYPQGKLIITKDKISIFFEEGAKKYDLIFDLAEADKGLQLIKKEEK